ncbi:hypothetical protein ACFYRL_02890 [Streptomyces goshikiensis]|uniref:hypothetical protein n=1 Tax=Streptomyces goshikiensis TaxID=1942 RepID=UPI0036A7711B
MPIARSDIHELVTSYLKRHPGERELLAALLEDPATASGATDPAAPPTRVTCSAVVIDRARRWRGSLEVREPDRCLSWGWWPTDALPDPIVPYARAAIEGIRAGRPYTELGWT